MKQSLFVIYGLKLKGELEPVRYIGQTRHGATTRFKAHLQNTTSTYPVHRWIQLNLEDVECVVIEEFDSEDALNNREIYWIEQLGTFIEESGYNLTLGGGGVSGSTWILSDETKARQAIAKRNHWQDDEARARHIEALKLSKSDIEWRARQSVATKASNTSSKAVLANHQRWHVARQKVSSSCYLCTT